ncbi:hypothetical protein CFII64_12923 [Pseudomonas sp. CFII64]|nr:hypothetical protein CFII64_12923 [Pseudomonas sp. CFII64]
MQDIGGLRQAADIDDFYEVLQAAKVQKTGLMDEMASRRV